MRWLLFSIALPAFFVGACDVGSTTGSDFGVELPGCRGPSQCWMTLHCPCNFATIGDCMKCDPAAQPDGVCTCSSFDEDGSITLECTERAQVCVGRAATTCDGLCVRYNQTCMLGAGDPPNEVASVVAADGGPGTEKRCPYADDHCCD